MNQKKGKTNTTRIYFEYFNGVVLCELIVTYMYFIHLILHYFFAFC